MTLLWIACLLSSTIQSSPSWSFRKDAGDGQLIANLDCQRQSHFRSIASKFRKRLEGISNQGLMVMMMLIMSVIVTIRTGQCASHSAPWFTWVPATGLAQNHSSPEVAR